MYYDFFYKCVTLLHHTMSVLNSLSERNVLVMLSKTIWPLMPNVLIFAMKRLIEENKKEGKPFWDNFLLLDLSTNAQKYPELTIRSNIFSPYPWIFVPIEK